MKKSHTIRTLGDAARIAKSEGGTTWGASVLAVGAL